jgi:hypothetical protein
MRTLLAVMAAVVALGVTSPAFAQRDSGTTRSVHGVVTDGADNPLEGAVVQLKDTKTLQVRSFISRKNGTYQFNGLSADVDYEIKADHQGKSSDSKTLSSFDSRRQAVMNLKISK